MVRGKRPKMKLDKTKTVLGCLVVLISVFMLLFIFGRAIQLNDQCSIPGLRTFICTDQTSISSFMIFFVVLISGLIFIIVATSYILLSSR